MRQNLSKFQEFIKSGNACYEKREYRKALRLYLKARKICRQDRSANLNCANACYMLKKYSQALCFLRKLESTYPDDMAIIHLLAHCFFECQNYVQAEKYFERAVRFCADNAWYHNYLSQAYQKNGKYEKAVESAWQALMIEKEDITPHQLNFGYLLYELSLDNQQDTVVHWAEKWQVQFPQNQLAQYLGGAVCGRESSVNNRNIGISQIFDAFAPEFEVTLRDLTYKTPEYIAKILSDFKIKKTRILDLGCGTGLCGMYLKKYAKYKSLYGIDISENMLKEAEKKHIYTCLICEDLQTYLSREKEEYGLIAAADVFTYIPKLDNVILGIYTALKDGGYAVFSITSSDEKEDYTLHKSGRYKHNPEYIKRIIAASGLKLLRQENCVIRYEDDKPVNGIIYLVQKTCGH